MYQALYRKYRPTNLNQIAGQKVVVKTLINSIINNKISHAYLFAGPRGTGKTSIAKILAKTINCECLDRYIPCEKCDSCLSINSKKTVDIIEIDAASNNGVDEIRELKTNVNLVPSNSKYKVYIIDEVHMLTISAFNALLKTLEEPPEYVIFILATTEIHKVPETILSRCQKFEFKKINNIDLKNKLLEITKMEKIKIDNNAIDLISKYSNGGMRDAINLLDQINAYKLDKITENDVLEVCGNITSKQMFMFINDIFEKNIKESLKKLKEYDENGKNLILIFNNLIDYLKNLLIYMNASDYFNDKELIKEFETLIPLINEKNIYDIINILIENNKNMKYESNKKLLAELTIIKIIQNTTNNNNVIKTLNDKENNNNEQKKFNSEINLSNKTNNIDKLKLEKFKQVRVNNALSKFKKKFLLDFIPKLEELNELLINHDYSSLVSLILDGNLKIKGDEYLVFVYPNDQLSLYFNSEIEKIEEIFSKKFNRSYKVVAINIEEWDKYKEDFNNNLKTGNVKYKFLEEDKNLLDIYIKSSDNVVNKINNIDNEFSEIVKYE